MHEDYLKTILSIRSCSLDGHHSSLLLHQLHSRASELHYHRTCRPLANGSAALSRQVYARSTSGWPRFIHSCLRIRRITIVLPNCYYFPVLPIRIGKDLAGQPSNNVCGRPPLVCLKVWVRDVCCCDEERLGQQESTYGAFNCTKFNVLHHRQTCSKPLYYEAFRRRPLPPTVTTQPPALTHVVLKASLQRYIPGRRCYVKRLPAPRFACDWQEHPLQ